MQCSSYEEEDLPGYPRQSPSSECPLLLVLVQTISPTPSDYLRSIQRNRPVRSSIRNFNSRRRHTCLLCTVGRTYWHHPRQRSFPPFNSEYTLSTHRSAQTPRWASLTRRRLLRHKIPQCRRLRSRLSRLRQDLSQIFCAQGRPKE